MCSLIFRERGQGERKREKERERERERERNIYLREKHRLVDYHMCPDQGLNPQTRYVL